MMLPGMENEDRREELSQFYTPPDIAARMAELADVKGKRVLEPSAGSGNLVRAALDAGAYCVDAYDIDLRNVNAIRARFKEYDALADRRDFLAVEHTADVNMFDVALMNPPWNDGVHWRHILHALKFAPRVVALAPLAMLEGADRREQFWAKVHLTELCVCSNRPKFSADGGQMPVAAYVIERCEPGPDKCKKRLPPSCGIHPDVTVHFWP